MGKLEKGASTDMREERKQEKCKTHLVEIDEPLSHHDRDLHLLHDPTISLQEIGISNTLSFAYLEAQARTSRLNELFPLTLVGSCRSLTGHCANLPTNGDSLGPMRRGRPLNPYGSSTRRLESLRRWELHQANSRLSPNDRHARRHRRDR